MRLHLGGSIDELKEQLRARVDAEAENARLQFITGGSGQAMAYQAKEAEALLFEADGTIGPHLAAEADAMGQEVATLVAIILASAGMWRQVSALIEAVRLGAKQAITAAETIQEAQLAAADIVWPTPP